MAPNSRQAFCPISVRDLSRNLKEYFYADMPYSPAMDKTALIALLTAVILIALFSALALIFLSSRPLLIGGPAFENHGIMQTGSAISRGSTLLITFNYTNTGTKSLTLERFYIFGSYGKNDTVSGNPPQQEIPGLVVDFNGTAMNNAENLNFVLQPKDSVLTSITIPNYSQYLDGTYVNFNVVQKDVVSGSPGISISSG
jgi:hypothetical protein